MLKRRWWIFLVMAAAGAIIGWVVAAAVTSTSLWVYESEAVIEEKPWQLGGTFCTFKAKPIIFNTGGFPVQSDVIKSHHLLETVIRNLDLTNRWQLDGERTLQMLKAMVSREYIRGTEIVSIRVHHTNKVDARDIAMEVGRAYKNYREEIDKRKREQSLAELDKAVKEQEVKVEERREILGLVTNPLKNIQVDGTETLLNLVPSQEYWDAKRDFETDQALLQTLKLKQVSENMLSKLSNDRVVFYKEAVVSDASVFPNVTLNLMLGAALGFLLFSLVACLGFGCSAGSRFNEANRRIL